MSLMIYKKPITIFVFELFLNGEHLTDIAAAVKEKFKQECTEHDVVLYLEGKK